jgi:hypothetical protein
MVSCKFQYKIKFLGLVLIDMPVSHISVVDIGEMKRWKG